ncbi:putative nmra-like family protein [Neofusicoccum parvum UCRNP2]|uniref:Putative nmra-like family protein n=1 Tax=Botryosphaeria parva (strain UCR-NP2) TaxID=1287680 RepID=R1ES98_BOTPV|nr:putative nmra-like family protein [Neofusicoccum parvum UCRNP2]
MVKVAVAGGLGNLGRTITEVLQNDAKHEVVVISRKASSNTDVPVIAVDYSNVNNLRTALEENQVHTVICALMVMDETAGQSQINLIKAADKSSSTKRFIVSEYGIPVPSKFSLDAVEEARKTNLEFTSIYNGHFLDYFGRPHIKTYQGPLTFVLDVANKTAAIPGTGDEPIVFTYSFDVAKFVSASLDLAEWPEELFVIGDRTTWNEFVKLAEEARGTKFKVHYEDPEKLERFEVMKLPGHEAAAEIMPWDHLRHFCGVFENWLVQGYYNLPTENTLNERFPDIKTLTVKEMVEQNWKGI